MRSVFAPLALAALAMASPRPAAVSSSIAPAASAPAGCSENHALFSIEIVNVTSSGKRSLSRRDTSLTMTLTDGVLTDPEGRTGYIASNSQFQFDSPPQAGAIYTAGFSVCSNGSLAIGGSAIWYKCLSGTFYNLYDESSGGQCSPVYIVAAAAAGGSSASTTAAPASSAPASSAPASATSVAAESSDGQITATPISSTASAECSEYVDGQPQCSSVVASATAECSEYVDGQPQCSSVVASATAECSEYVDGQPQCSSVVASATPSAECSEYVDGQPQCSSVAAPTPSAECSEYVDGQPQCSSAVGTGGYATGTGAAASASYTGPVIQNAAAPTGLPREIFGLAAGVLAIALL